MTDFSKTLVRASAVYGIMVDVNGKSNYDKWQDALNSIVSLQDKHNAFRDKECKTAVATALKLEELKAQIPELEARRNDEPPLSEGCKSFLSKLYAAEKYGKWSTFRDKGNKYTAKGKHAEEESITLISRLDKRVYVKNDVRINNEWVSGIPDIVVGDSYGSINYVIDVKSPYDIETYIENLGKPLKLQYQWQIQTYMWLTGAEMGEVSFCLVNTPDFILNSERRRLFDRVGSLTEEDPKYKEEEKRLINNLTFDDMPLADRRIKFMVERDEEAHAKIAKRVEQCREHLCEIEKMHLDAIEFGQYQESLVP